MSRPETFEDRLDDLTKHTAIELFEANYDLDDNTQRQDFNNYISESLLGSSVVYDNEESSIVYEMATEKTLEHYNWLKNTTELEA